MSDITYCSKEGCLNTECKRHRSKASLESSGNVSYANFDLCFLEKQPVGYVYFISDSWIANHGNGEGLLIQEVPVIKETELKIRLADNKSHVTMLDKRDLGVYRKGCVFSRTPEDCLLRWDQHIAEHIESLQKQIESARKRVIYDSFSEELIKRYDPLT